MRDPSGKQDWKMKPPLPPDAITTKESRGEGSCLNLKEKAVPHYKISLMELKEENRQKGLSFTLAKTFILATILRTSTLEKAKMLLSTGHLSGHHGNQPHANAYEKR